MVATISQSGVFRCLVLSNQLSQKTKIISLLSLVNIYIYISEAATFEFFAILLENFLNYQLINHCSSHWLTADKTNAWNF